MSQEFRTLVVHFFGRFFDKDSRAEESDAYTGIVQLLALLVTPGLVLSFAMMTGNPFASSELARQWARVGDRYVFVCYAIVVMGLVMTLKWDSLFPDKRDYLILSSLPISMRRMFAAKVCALIGFLLLFSVAINFFSMITVPFLYLRGPAPWSQMFGAFEAHAGAVLGASLFTALFFASLQGVLINILSPTAFRRISPRIQMVSITVLVMVFLTLPLFKEGIRPLSEQWPDALGHFPFIWFLGFYESFLPGETLMPMAVAWGRTAIVATEFIAIVCSVSYIVGYRRYSKKLLESEDSDALPPSWWQSLTSSILNRSVLRDPFQRATFYFIGKIANRSPKHRIMTALYIGTGIALAIGFAFIFEPRSKAIFPFRLSPQGSLDATVMLSFLLITGLRATFNVPYELGANWMFQVTAGSSVDYLAAVRKWVFLCRILPLYTVLAALEFLFFTPLTAISHLTFDLLLAAVLIELFFLNFNKVPFTCSYPKDKFRLAGLAVGYFYGFATFVAIMGGLKHWVSLHPAGLVVYVIITSSLLALISVFRRYRRDRTARVIYQESADAPLSISADAGYWMPRPAPAKKVGVVATRRPMREIWTWSTVEQVLQDFRLGSRILWKSPGVSVTAIVLIALVIGGNTSIYSMVHALISKPAPGVEASNLMSVGNMADQGDFGHAYPDYIAYATQNKSLQPLVGIEFERFNLGLKDGTYGMLGAAVTPKYFEMLGVRPALGRTLDGPASDGGLVVMISYRIWQERFQGSGSVIGQSISLNGKLATIVGVAPPRFQGAFLGSPDDVWVPLVEYNRAQGKERLLNDRSLPTIAMLGKLSPSSSVSQAQAEFSALANGLEATYPSPSRKRSVRVFEYSATAFGGLSQSGPRFLAVFSIVTVLTLLIVCANVANLMLARAVARQRETAVRQSLGAPRFRILQMLIAEGLTLSLTAWAGACVFAYWVSRTIIRLVPVEATNGLGLRANHVNMDFAPDWRVLAYAMLLAVIGTVAFTLAPAIRTWKQHLLPHLKAGEQSVAQGRTKLSSVLVVAQLAFSVVLLTSAGLAYRSLSWLGGMDLRFNPSNLLLMTINPATSAANRSETLTLLERFRERLKTVPGVNAVSYVRLPPPYIWGREPVRRTTTSEALSASINYAGPDYLRVLGLKAQAGREFMDDDRVSVVRKILVNANLAESLWPGQSAISQTLVLRDSQQPAEVVGVTPDALFSGFQTEARPNFIFLAEQQDSVQAPGNVSFRGSGEITFYLRYSGNLDTVASSAAASIRDVDSRIPVIFVRTMEKQLDTITLPSRVVTTLLVFFSVVSLVIATIGQYAVISFDMRRRTRELGVRVALGASSQQIIGSVVRDSLMLTAIGLALGFVLSLGAGTAIRSLLYGVTPTDPPTYAGVFVLLSAASLVACYLPARRASRADPLAALRCE
jgi:macrolide transport system ATP-binding/permease protein